MNGKTVFAPKDLYIPPEALEVFLEAFEGPLDLLLYLIRKQHLDVLDLPMTEITRQYMEYVELMKAVKLELAAEYLVMAALLAEIKSRMLLPKPPQETETEEDPRVTLIRRLKEYEVFKDAADGLDKLPRTDRELFVARATLVTPKEVIPAFPNVDLKELVLAMQSMLKRASDYEHHAIKREKLSTRERMSQILALLQEQVFTPFTQVLEVDKGKAGVVVSFLAVLELCKLGLIRLLQSQVYGPIQLSLVGTKASE